MMRYLTTTDFEPPIQQHHKRTVLGSRQCISSRDGKTVFFYKRLLRSQLQYYIQFWSLLLAKHKFKLEQAKGNKNTKRDGEHLYSSEVNYQSGQKNLCQSKNEGTMTGHKKLGREIRTPFTIYRVKTFQNLPKRCRERNLSAFGKGANLWARSCSFCNSNCVKSIIMFQLLKKKCRMFQML